MKDFAGKVAVVTGAGSGFGREFARIGASLGMKLSLADIQGQGGYLQVDQARTFIKRTIEQAELMPDMMNSLIKSHTAELPRIVFGSRILHAGQSGAALPDGKRSKPTTSKVRAMHAQ